MEAERANELLYAAFGAPAPEPARMSCGCTIDEFEYCEGADGRNCCANCGRYLEEPSPSAGPPVLDALYEGPRPTCDEGEVPHDSCPCRTCAAACEGCANFRLTLEELEKNRE